MARRPLEDLTMVMAMWTPNTTDAQGKRYCYGRQPDIALWNLVQLANALMPVVDDEDILRDGLTFYRDTYRVSWQLEFGKKIGLETVNKEDDALIENLLSILSLVETDWTLFFRSLAKINIFDRRLKIENILKGGLKIFF